VTIDEVNATVDRSAALLSEPARSAFELRRVGHQLVPKLLDDGTIAEIWMVAEVPESAVWIGFWPSGYDGGELRWGLLLTKGTGVGDSGSWYRDLSEVLGDSGFF
jgi:hypothetical protein